MTDTATPPIQPTPSDEATTMALANCAAIVTGVIANISGTAISKTIQSSPLTQEAIANLSLGRITQNLIARNSRAANGTTRV